MMRRLPILFLLALGACSGGETTAAADVAPDAVDTQAADVSVDTPAQDAITGEVSDTGACECPPKMHCDEAMLCQADVCTKGAATCSALDKVKVCDADGASFEEFACQGDNICFGGVCWDPVCEPQEVGGCDGAALLQCNSLGIEWVGIPCPAGQACQQGECREVVPNVVLLLDTSGSMNWLSSGAGSPVPCSGAGCDPPWSFPSCDNPNQPRTGLGKAKAALSQLLLSPAVDSLRLALQRFPQVPWSPVFLGSTEPNCDEGGLWAPSGGTGLITGDDNSRITSDAGWFTSHVGEIVPVPFDAQQGTNAAELSRWVDFQETTQASGGACGSAAQCQGGPCVGGTCQTYDNPEIRAVGATPLGKSLFYAGEYFRHFVLVEGRQCQAHADCASPHHVCVAGECHDTLAHCRKNIIIVFTDGEETENVHVTDFFHPRVQAKRLHHGLGCVGDSDCRGGASCDAGVCRPPSSAVDETEMVCETGGLPCSTTADCPDPCAAWTGCQGLCTPAAIDLVDGVGADIIRDKRGDPASITVHVVDASGIPGANKLISAYGGGSHFSIDLSDSGEILDTLRQIIGDAKADSNCAGN